MTGTRCNACHGCLWGIRYRTIHYDVAALGVVGGALIVAGVGWPSFLVVVLMTIAAMLYAHASYMRGWVDGVSTDQQSGRCDGTP